MPSDGALVVRALGYWAGWLYFARRFGWPPPDDKSKKPADGGKKQPDKGTKASAGKDAPKAAAAPAKSAPPKAASAKTVESKTDSKADGGSKKPSTGGDVSKEKTTPPVEPVAKQAESTSHASFWSRFESTDTAKSTSKDWPKETGLHEWKGDDAKAGSTDKAAPSK